MLGEKLIAAVVVLLVFAGCHTEKMEPVQKNIVKNIPLEYPDVLSLHVGIGRYINYYNRERPHQSLGYVPPAVKYLGIQPAAVSPMGDFNGEVALVSSRDSWGARLQGTALTRGNQKKEKISHFKIC
ncbi:MAG: hypothetical protein A2020_09430 [Lentisphaerae bacterium GWF2_45_14]|nr:MAG: hypothetical protein A2020_09430 [Lentisphaerae bacterium GWF2_45_14]